jgi:peptidyl-Lys metalloendopeptidase
MLRIFACVISLFLLSNSAAVAQNFYQCEKTEIAALGDALKGAHNIGLRAAVAIGDTENYRRWFGPYSKANAEIARTTLKAIYSTILTGQIRVICLNASDDGCEDDTYAFVYPDEAFVVNICPQYFELPTMISDAPDSAAMENGTREGTILHEVSHFIRVAGTDDFWYSRETCEIEAQTDPRSAIRNADSYQYFAEDTTFYPTPSSDQPG